MAEAARRRRTDTVVEQQQQQQPQPPNDRPPRTARWPNSLVTLAIETSCDDTCVAVLEKEKDDGPTAAGRPRKARLLFEERVTADNRAFGGIHPLAAAESHMAALAPLVERALAYVPGGADADRPDFVAATRGPGMAGSLANGLALAKGLATAWRVPLVGVHHMQAHALTPRLVAALAAAGGGGGGDASAASGSSTAATAPATATPAAVAVAFPYLALLAAAGRSLPYGALLEGFAFGAGDDQDGGVAAAYQYPAARRDEMAPFVYVPPASAADGDRPGWRLEAPLATNERRRALCFDFSGLNGAVIKLAGGDPPTAAGAGAVETTGCDDDDAAPTTAAATMPDDERRVLARATMQLAFEHLASRLLLALADGQDDKGGKTKVTKSAHNTPAPTTNNNNNDDDGPSPAAASCLVVAGGVASNRFLRRVLRSALDVRGYGHLPLVAPPPALCTDNAAMIAWAGMELYEAGWQTDLGVLPLRKWSLDARALGVGGWVRRW
ncbi:Peptidase M22, glycoprotease [Niveomyces insectorum RCEF 264]|uniref:N(6)-L-threonylcarbamoyladenine synthase n=1 Tax=Niveomyces insectorum RCEF 264 TaxID=1081102 RepID=A0A167YVL1_9HYPO|nr:Peptidase M22, glycoprotease [Niveomyces insectorum RCEF 264]